MHVWGRMLGAAAVLSAIVGCTFLPSNLRAPIESLRTRGSTCVQGLNGPALSSTVITTCLESGSPGTLSDDGATPYLHSEFGSDSFELSNPGNWQLEVWYGQTEIFKEMLPRSVPDIGMCGSYGCIKHGFALSRMPLMWGAGVYTFRYICSFDTSRTSVVKIELVGGTPVLISASPLAVSAHPASDSAAQPSAAPSPQVPPRTVVVPK